MGLDWTAALLPQERPAWSTTSEEPVSPPSAFILPPPTTVYLPHENGRAKHTATWTWEEDEWKVLRKLEGSSTSRVERPLPSLKEEVHSSRLLKAAGVVKDVKDAAHIGHGKKDKEKEAEEDSESDEPLTDPDGWIYADNKWEGSSGKGSMGKYTRYRRWTRIAVLKETVELVGPGEVGAVVHKRKPSRTGSTSSSSPPPSATSVDGEGERTGIRKRLAAVIGSSVHS